MLHRPASLDEPLERKSRLGASALLTATTPEAATKGRVSVIVEYDSLLIIATTMDDAERVWRILHSSNDSR
jgi:hypothetical protein